MKNITLSMDEELIKAGREYAKVHHTSFNNLIRSLVQKTVKGESAQWVLDTFELMDETNASSEGQKWSREDLYRV